MLIKTSACTLFLLCSIYVTAQFKKGDRMVGASIASIFYNNTMADVTVGTTTTNSFSKNYNISINPMYGWFVADNIAVGVTFNINPIGQSVSYENNGNTYQKDKTNGLNLGAGVFGRSYFGKNGTFLPFG